ncbi:MAG TPA: HNH endonuclease signature motif containing protein [Steroidobacteraceae bacterium]|nr:HNH endonuclease signature motif containing protein [Steroidobacteraceae bacterium]
MSTYSEKLRDPRWQRRRLEKLNEAEFTCEICTDTRTTLHVHHRVYERGRNPWDYDLDDLEVLCEGCHEIKHEQLAVLNRVISRASYLDLEGLTAVVAGYLMQNEPHARAKEQIASALGEVTTLGVETIKAGRIAAIAEKKFFARWLKREEDKRR